MEINGRNLHLEIQGPENGSPVVLLHHGLGTVRAWRGQVPALAEAGFHVVAYDRWGYGGSDERPAVDIPIFAADLADLESVLDALGLARAALVGHSDGGTIALRFAAQRPARVSAWSLWQPTSMGSRR